MTAHIVLYDWPASPFSLKVRAILEYKRLTYTKVPILAPRNLLEVYRRGKVGKAPALEIDGTLFVDSTDIAYVLEDRFPDPPVIPSSTREKALCHALEEWADESLYFVNLYYQWHDPEGRKLVPQVFGRGMAGQLAYRFYLLRVMRQIRGQGTARKQPEHVLSDLKRHLAALEALVKGAPFLLGGRPFLCDFAFLGQITYLDRTPVGSRVLVEYPAIIGYREHLKQLRKSPDAMSPPG